MDQFFDIFESMDISINQFLKMSGINLCLSMVAFSFYNSSCLCCYLTLLRTSSGFWHSVPTFFQAIKTKKNSHRRCNLDCQSRGLLSW